VSTAEAKKCLERCHGLSPTVVPKDELVKVDLQVTTAYAMVGTDDPLLEIANSAIGQRSDGQHTLAEFGPQRLSTGHVLEPDLLQASEACPPVRVYRGPRCNIPDNEVVHRRAGKVVNDLHPDATRALPALLDCRENQRCLPVLELTTAAEARLLGPDPSIVNLYLAMERLAGRVHHCPPQLVKHHPRSFITTQSKLALKQERRKAAFVGRYQVRRPKPHCKWSLRVVEDCPRCERNLVSAGDTLPATTLD
jgi:hypothetical protein